MSFHGKFSGRRIYVEIEPGGFQPSTASISRASFERYWIVSRIHHSSRKSHRKLRIFISRSTYSKQHPSGLIQSWAIRTRLTDSWFGTHKNYHPKSATLCSDLVMPGIDLKINPMLRSYSSYSIFRLIPTSSSMFSSPFALFRLPFIPHVEILTPWLPSRRSRTSTFPHMLCYFKSLPWCKPPRRYKCV